MKTLVAAFAALLLALSGRGAERESRARTSHEPFATATFHCLGLYWSPVGGAADKPAQVRFRPQGATAWQDGLPDALSPDSGDGRGFG